ncbi:rCG34030 [Rattus norvegicus]|uniref:RCG34030 n=1 Tax=Rattus norvegicus TaxID=10116 RepID=A6HI88_RAT|nr:rCG34030 [Rattus norvegicus]
METFPGSWRTLESFSLVKVAGSPRPSQPTLEALPLLHSVGPESSDSVTTCYNHKPSTGPSLQTIEMTWLSLEGGGGL